MTTAMPEIEAPNFVVVREIASARERPERTPTKIAVITREKKALNRSFIIKNDSKATLNATISIAYMIKPPYFIYSTKITYECTA